jgi:predicted metal-dependent phosphoesterase TrpH
MLACLCLAATAVYADFSTLPTLPDGGRVRPVNRYFDVTPRIAKADAEATIVIQPLFDHVRFRPNCTYEFTYTALDQVHADKSPFHGKPQPVTPADNRITLTLFLAGEQEHLLVLEEISGDKRKVMGEFHLYTVKDDLLSLRPFKGDFHMHSNNSDGVESAPYVAGACRRAGLDWMALSDHKKYEPSAKLPEAFQGVPIDLRIYPGEECHSPDNPVHIIAFGHNSGIRDLYMDTAEPQARAEVAELLKKLPPLPQDVKKWDYASCQWVTSKIHERGGLAMLCHPYWVTRGAHNDAEALLGALLNSKFFDMLEVVSGNSSAETNEYDSNTLQASRYAEARANGLKLPVCGISDAHGCERSEMFGRYFTVAFAPTPDLANIQSAIKQGNCTAVEIMRGERPRVEGNYRLVKYSLFLLREVLPQHDELCIEEGRLMLSYSAGKADAVERLKACQGQVKALYDQYWSR